MNDDPPQRPAIEPLLEALFEGATKIQQRLAVNPDPLCTQRRQAEQDFRKSLQRIAPQTEPTTHVVFPEDQEPLADGLSGSAGWSLTIEPLEGSPPEDGSAMGSLFTLVHPRRATPAMSGVLLYGTHTGALLRIEDGPCQRLRQDPITGLFRVVDDRVQIPATGSLPTARGSIVAALYRLVQRGGIHATTSLTRLHRAPVPFVVAPVLHLLEGAGGRARAGAELIHFPLTGRHTLPVFLFGSPDPVIQFDDDTTPLFGERGLFRR